MMRKTLLIGSALAALVFTSCSSAPKNVARKIADPVFRGYCLSTMDLDRNDKLSLAEVEAVSEIAVPNLRIQSLAGLEYFKNLKSIDFSGTGVESFGYNLPALEVIKCANDKKLSSLDLAGCPSLSFIYASHTGVKTVTLGAQAGLYRLWIDNTPVSELDITGCPKLNNVNVRDCPNLKELTFSPEVNRDILYLSKDDVLVVK